MIRSDSEEKRSALFNKYAVAVDRLQKAFQDKGDLTNAVKAKKEAEIARKSSLIGKEDIPGFNRIREILREEIAKIDRMELSRTVQARKNNIKQLRTRVTELTKEGKLGGSTQDRCRAEGSGNVFGRRHQAFGKSRHQKA